MKQEKYPYKLGEVILIPTPRGCKYKAVVGSYHKSGSKPNKSEARISAENFITFHTTKKERLPPIKGGRKYISAPPKHSTTPVTTVSSFPDLEYDYTFSTSD